jgi:ATP-dependent Clp protease adaptor protein ClpS
MRRVQNHTKNQLERTGPSRVQGRRSVFSGTGLETPDLDVADEVALDSPWNVVVHNDPVNLMSYVTRVLQKVLGFTRERAEKHMMEVHKTGRSIVWTGAREKAELYVQQLQGFLLLTTLERSS